MDEFFLYPFTRGFLKFSFNVVCCATIILIASATLSIIGLLLSLLIANASEEYQTILQHLIALP